MIMRQCSGPALRLLIAAACIALTGMACLESALEPARPTILGAWAGTLEREPSLCAESANGPGELMVTIDTRDALVLFRRYHDGTCCGEVFDRWWETGDSLYFSRAHNQVVFGVAYRLESDNELFLNIYGQLVTLNRCEQ